MSKVIESVNCGACGEEHARDLLKTIRLAGISMPILICEKCATLSSEDSFKGAKELLSDVVVIAVDENISMEDRISEIRRLIGDS